MILTRKVNFPAPWRGYMKHLFAAIVAVVVAGPGLADLPEGNWRLAQMVNASVDSPSACSRSKRRAGS